MTIKKVSKKLLSALIAIILLLGLVPIVLPITVKAVTTSGTNFYQPDGTGSTTIYQKIHYGDNLWRVLDVDTDEHNELFLLSDDQIRHGNFGSRNLGNSYETSGIRTYLAENYMNNFSAKEQSAISKQDVLEDIDFQGEGVSTPNNEGDSVFLLSLAELGNSVYFPNGNIDKVIGISWWWLRSAGSSDDLVLGVDSYGRVAESRVYVGNKVRPALKLNLSSVLFTSAVNGEHSKPAAKVIGFSILSPTVRDEVKLTILDTDQELSANMSTTEAAEDGKLYVDNYSYTGVPTQNGYLSAIFDDGNGNIYYSRIMEITNSTGSGEKLAIDLTGIPLGYYTFKLFTEQVNGGTKTDYASNIVEFTEIEVDPVAVEEIELDDTLELGVEGIYTLTPTFIPRNATNQNVTWTSSDDTVVTVDSNGKIKAISIGTAIITVTALDGGFTDDCEVTVNLPVTNITLNETELTLEVDDTATLVATIDPDNATDKGVTWTSDDESVATVDENGNVTAIGAGNAVITVTTNNNDKTATCMVTVTAPVPIDIPVTGVALNTNELTLEIGEGDILDAIITPNNATNKDVTWASDDEAIVTIDNSGKVTAIGEGIATITVTTDDGGHKAYCTITVTAVPPVDIPVIGVTLSTKTLALEIGEDYTLVADINFLRKNFAMIDIRADYILAADVDPNNTVNKGVAWTSSDDTVAEVDSSGKVKAIGTGTATITVTTADGNFTDTCEVTVTTSTKIKTPTQSTTYTQSIIPAKITTPVTDISLNRNIISLAVGESELLAVAIVPTNATNQNVIWTSSDEMVAIVDSNGNITAVSVGTATITAESVDGNKTDICTVTVTNEINETNETDATKSNLPSNMYTTAQTIPATGDTSAGVLLFIGLISSMFCIIIILIFHRKRIYT